jgi:hypothetical protein
LIISVQSGEQCEFLVVVRTKELISPRSTLEQLISKGKEDDILVWLFQYVVGPTLSEVEAILPPRSKHTLIAPSAEL